jgi:uncharacterized membrane protein
MSTDRILTQLELLGEQVVANGSETILAIEANAVEIVAAIGALGFDLDLALTTQTFAIDAAIAAGAASTVATVVAEATQTRNTITEQLHEVRVKQDKTKQQLDAIYRVINQDSFIQTTAVVEMREVTQALDIIYNMLFQASTYTKIQYPPTGSIQTGSNAMAVVINNHFTGAVVYVGDIIIAPPEGHNVHEIVLSNKPYIVQQPSPNPTFTGTFFLYNPILPF